MKTCKDCVGHKYKFCKEQYTDEQIEEYTTGDIRTLCMLFKDVKDFVEVTRCKNCNEYMSKSGRCWRMCFPMSPDDYCSYGGNKK